jgi:hypothetical protein
LNSSPAAATMRSLGELDGPHRGTTCGPPAPASDMTPPSRQPPTH